MSKVRDSNIELLRIVATLFIVILHCNGWLLSICNKPALWDYGDYSIQIPRMIIQNITVIGVDLFILISGFYGIKPKLKSVINLYTCLAFFYVGSYLADVCINMFVYSNEIFSVKTFIKQFMVFSRENWYINCYLFLMLLSPVLNVFMDNVSKKTATWYLSIFLVCSFYFGCIQNHNYFYFNEGYSVTMMILVYLIGRYMRIHLSEKIKTIKYSYLVYAYLVSLVLLIGNYLLSKFTISSLEAYNNPIIILSAVCFFWLFYRMPTFRNKFINAIGTSCLSVYIFHTCAPWIGYLIKTNEYFFYNLNFFSYAIVMLVVIGLIFAISVVLDKIRLFIFKPVLNSKLLKK